jgi:hypothetical protein
MDRIRYSPILIFNAGEIGTTILEGKYQNVISLRGGKQVAALTSS